MKTQPYSANKAKLFVTDFFFSNEPYLCLSEKGILRCMWRDLGMNLPLLVTFVCISYFLHKFTLILPVMHSSSHEGKKS